MAQKSKAIFSLFVMKSNFESQIRKFYYDLNFRIIAFS